MAYLTEKKKAIVYGRLSPDRVAELERYLAENGMEMACPPFLDEEGTGTYPELHKALYFALRLGCNVTLVSVQEEINDTRFLDILEKTETKFDCPDFPWLKKENVPLLKALTVYGKEC